MSDRPDNEASSVEQEEEHSLHDHLTLLSKPVIIVFIINAFLWNMGGAVISVLTFSYCEETGSRTASKAEATTAATTVMTMYGVGSLVGSLFVTILSSLHSHFSSVKLNRYFLHIFCNILMAITSIIIPLVYLSHAAIVVCLFIIGAGYGTLCSNLGSIIQHLNGPHLLYLVYGYYLAAAGVGSLIGPIIATHLDTLIGLGTAFYFAGASMVTAFAIFGIYAVIDRSIVLPFAQRIEMRNKTSNVNDQN